jgi:glucosamine-6-phosphate deaminase
MEVIIRPSSAEAAMLAARLIADALRVKPHLVLGLATGRTMEQVYDLLADMELDFTACRTFNLDEYIGVPPEDDHSYRSYMNQRLFQHVNIRLTNTHVPDGMADDLGEEAARYDRMIGEAGGIDLQLLGIGEDGHIGFNEPLSSLMSAAERGDVRGRCGSGAEACLDDGRRNYSGRAQGGSPRHWPRQGRGPRPCR